MNSNLSVCIVILNYNGYKDTKTCIISLKDINYQNTEIVVVDNASSDNSFENLMACFPHIKFLRTSSNLGYAGGMNTGAKYALRKGFDLILLANNDIIFTNNFLPPLVKRISSNSEIGIISPKVLYSEKKDIIYCAGGEFKISHCGMVNLFQGKRTSVYGNTPRFLNVAEGACMLIKREVYEKVGFMNESYFMYFEDLEFSWRAKKSYKIFYEPKSIIYHKSGAGTSWLNYTPLYYYYYTRNRLLFFSGLNLFYKSFAFVFTILNTLLKNISLFYALIVSNDKRKIYKSILSIWRGTFDGVKFLFKLPIKLN